MSKDDGLTWSEATAVVGRFAVMVASGAAVAVCVALIFAVGGFAYGIAEAVVRRAVGLGLDLARLVL